MLKILFNISYFIVIFIFLFNLILASPISNDVEEPIKLSQHCINLCTSCNGEPDFDNSKQKCYCTLPPTRTDEEKECKNTMRVNARILDCPLIITEISRKLRDKRSDVIDETINNMVQAGPQNVGAASFRPEIAQKGVEGRHHLKKYDRLQKIDPQIAKVEPHITTEPEIVQSGLKMMQTGVELMQNGLQTLKSESENEAVNNELMYTNASDGPMAVKIETTQENVPQTEQNLVEETTMVNFEKNNAIVDEIPKEDQEIKIETTTYNIYQEQDNQSGASNVGPRKSRQSRRLAHQKVHHSPVKLGDLIHAAQERVDNVIEKLPRKEPIEKSSRVKELQALLSEMTQKLKQLRLEALEARKSKTGVQQDEFEEDETRHHRTIDLEERLRNARERLRLERLRHLEENEDKPLSKLHRRLAERPLRQKRRPTHKFRENEHEIEEHHVEEKAAIVEHHVEHAEIVE